jgi:hypothetical protein
MPGRRFSAKQDRQAQHVADSYGGGKKALSIGYAVVNAQKKRKKKKH